MRWVGHCGGARVGVQFAAKKGDRYAQNRGFAELRGLSACLALLAVTDPASPSLPAAEPLKKGEKASARTRREAGSVSSVSNTRTTGGPAGLPPPRDPPPGDLAITLPACSLLLCQSHGLKNINTQTRSLALRSKSTE